MSRTTHIRVLPHGILALLAIVLASCSDNEKITSQQMRANVDEQEQQRVAAVQRQNQQLFTTHVHGGLEGCLRELFSISKNYSDLAVCRNTVEAKALTEYNAQGYAFLFRQHAIVRRKIADAVVAGKMTTQRAVNQEALVLAQMDMNGGAASDPDDVRNIWGMQFVSGMSYPQAHRYLQEQAARQTEIQ